jgi:urate oxidase
MESLTLIARKAAMNGLKAAAGPLDTATLILIKNAPPSIHPRMVMADIEECDFIGYAASAGLVFGNAYQEGDDTVVLTAPSVLFTCATDATPNTVTGWALTNAGKTILHFAKSLETPVVMNEAGDGLIVQPRVPYGS